MTDANTPGSPADPAASPPAGYPGALTPPPAPPQPTAAPPAYNAPPYGSAPGASGGQGSYYAQPVYPPQQQPYGYGYTATQKTNPLAIVSLISSIAAFVVLPFIASVVAVVTGHISLRQLKTSGESGRGMALAGTIVGWVGIGLAAIVGVLIMLWVIFVVNVASSSVYDYSS